MTAMLHDVVAFRRRAQARAIHSANHVDHQEREAWFPISMHACGFVRIVMGLHYKCVETRQLVSH